MTKIPEYSSLIRAGLDKAPDMVLRKIKRTYKIFDAPPNADEASISSKMSDDIDKFIDNADGKGWDIKKAQPTSGSTLNTEKAEELRELSRDFMKKAVESIALTEKILSMYDIETHKTHPNNIKMFEGNNYVSLRHIQSTDFGAYDLLRAYSSQLFLSAASKIKSFGFSDIESYEITGKLIGQSLKIFKAHNNAVLCEFSPQILPRLSKEDNLDAATDYWKKMRDSLNNQARTYKASLER